MKDLIERLKRTEYDDLDACKAAEALELCYEMLDHLCVGAVEWHTEIERLTAERDALNAEADRLSTHATELRKHRDALKADAERYRWLRNDSYDSEIGVWECRDMENRRIVLAGEELDDSVDAAIQGAKND